MLLAIHTEQVKHGVRLDELEGLKDLRELFAQQQDQIDKLTRQLRALTAEPDTDAVWDWTSMDQRQAAEAWTELLEWMTGEFTDHYDRLGTDQALHGDAKKISPKRLRVPECWPAHLDVVSELSALYQEWKAIYRQKGGTPARGIDWNSRFLPGVLHRIRYASTAAHCVHQHSNLAADPDAGRGQRRDEFDTAAYVQRDISSRPEPPADPQE